MLSSIVVGLDIGTTKVCTVIARILGHECEVIGVSVVPSHGLRKGVVIDIEETARSIAASIKKAEIQAGEMVRGVYIGISGGHIEGINSRGVIAIADKNQEITEADVKRVIDAATAIVLPVDRDLIHVIPQEFIVDSHEGIRDPVGMSAHRLEAVVHIITAATTSVNNTVKAVKKAGFEAQDIVLQPLAASRAILSDEERDMGVLVLDIGGGTTDYVIFKDGSLRSTGILSLGGNHVTSDISYGLKTSLPTAEEIKKRFGCAIADFVDEGEVIEVPGVGGRAPVIESRRKLAEIIQPRLEEIFSLVYQSVEKTGLLDGLLGGVVLTGGVSLTPYIVDLASAIFGMPVRIGNPLGIGGLRDMVDSPIYSTAVGLCLYAMDNSPRLGPTDHKDEEKNINSIVERLKEWVKEFF